MATDLPTQPDWNFVLDDHKSKIQRFQSLPGLRSKALGAPESDWELWRMGLEWLVAHTEKTPTAPPIDSSHPGQQPDVYLATQIYSNGGHTPLIGDYVRALDGAGEAGGKIGASSYLIITDLHGLNSTPLPKEMTIRVAMPEANIIVLKGPSMLERLEELFAQLLILKPRRLFLFHHPDDPLASVVAHPQIARQRILVHHADTLPSLGLYIPGIDIIDVTPNTSRLVRLQGLNSELLLLTAPDPGPRPHGFLKRGKLVTASSGSAHKFASKYAYGYAETVGVILRATGGWHVHIGPLDEPALAKIGTVLQQGKTAADRFIHVPWAATISGGLWEHECDLYFSSFPIDGARTDAEVASSATPHLRHSIRPSAELNRYELELDGGLVWRTWEDLTETLQSMASEAALEEKSKLIRQTYEKRHHPRIFAEHLKRILAGEGGCEDPQKKDRDLWAVHGILKAANVAILSQMERIDRQELRIDLLQNAVGGLERLAREERLQRLEHEREERQEREESKARIARLEQKVERLQSMRELWRTGKSFRERVLRWFMRL